MQQADRAALVLLSKDVQQISPLPLTCSHRCITMLQHHVMMAQ